MTYFTKTVPFLLVAAVMLVSAGQATAANKNLEPGCCAPEPPTPCCYEPCFHYKTHKLFVKKACPCSCCPPVEAVLQVVDPRCNCFVDVPVCLPSCCTGVPTIDSRCGLFHRGIVEYEWCCGFKIKMVFKQCGHVDVHYYGL
ncbi:hypothetical protein [Bremerella sp. P1]|uniref:hypothetical protein n=1 Tax=Bremerella sp. P1 TaxID=3026424 RepID=UPI0023681924|nr:hypothetical protein [Bremerella sp. P1]WDI40388.1 hypothetical protein PSR63_18075 [Bremerella sp. P1]